MTNQNKRAIIPPKMPVDGFVEVRGASGRLYGRFNPETMVIEFKSQRGGRGKLSDTERIDLRQYRRTTEEQRDV